MKITIDIPEKTIAHIRSDYGHGVKNIWNREDMKVIVEEIYRASKGYSDGKSLQEEEFFNYNSPNVLKSELEKIKAEIMSIGNWKEHYEMPIAYLSCLTIVEHHISELKGENNV